MTRPTLALLALALAAGCATPRPFVADPALQCAHDDVACKSSVERRIGHGALWCPVQDARQATVDEPCHGPTLWRR